MEYFSRLVDWWQKPIIEADMEEADERRMGALERMRLGSRRNTGNPLMVCVWWFCADADATDVSKGAVFYMGHVASDLDVVATL